MTDWTPTGTPEQDKDVQTPDVDSADQKDWGSIDWEKRYKDLQSKFTKVTQEKEPGETIDEETVEKLVEERTKKILDENTVNTTLKSVQSQLPQWLREQFEEEYKDITEGKKITADNVDKYVKKTLKIIGWVQDNQIRWLSSGSTQARSTGKESKEARKEKAQAFNQKFWL